MYTYDMCMQGTTGARRERRERIIRGKYELGVWCTCVKKPQWNITLYAHEKIWNWGLMRWFIKCLLHKHEDLSSDLWNQPIKSQVCVCNPGIGKAGTGSSPFPRSKVGSIRKTSNHDVWPPCFCALIHTNAHRHRHTLSHHHHHRN